MSQLTMSALIALFLLSGCDEKMPQEVGGNNADSPGARIDAHGQPLNPRGGPRGPVVIEAAPDATPDAAPTP